MPLMDDILIPYQNGRPLTPGWWYLVLLAALFGAGFVVGAGLGQDLSWRWCLERIASADLRTTTYEHCCACRSNTSAPSARAT